MCPSQSAQHACALYVSISQEALVVERPGIIIIIIIADQY